MTYIVRFLPNLLLELVLLYKLLKHNEPWHWTSRQKRAFERRKELFLSSQLLVHFDLSLEIHLACDALAYVIGAVLSHKMPHRSEKPVGLISCTLTDADLNCLSVRMTWTLQSVLVEQLPLLSTINTTSSEPESTPVVQEAPPNVEQDSETVTSLVENTSLPESTITCHLSLSNKRATSEILNFKYCFIGRRKSS